MIVDTSAILAVLFRGPEADELVEKLLKAEPLAVGAPTLLEASLVLTGRLGKHGEDLVARFVQLFGIATVPFDEAHWRVAADAFFRFGKGRHPAALNFGDCLTYATAKIADRPLLFVGDDFPKTDLGLA